MKLTKKQQNMIAEMVRDEAERVINGRKLAAGMIVENVPAGMESRVNDAALSDAVSDAALQIGDEQGVALFDKIVGPLARIVAEEANKLGLRAGGYKLTATDILTFIRDTDDEYELEFVFASHVRDACEILGGQLARVAVHVSEGALSDEE